MNILALGVSIACLAAADAQSSGRCEIRDGAIIRGRTDRRQLALEFTAHEYAEGAATILDALARRQAKASFFLTGDFLAQPSSAPVVRRMIAEGHYLGPHSDRHLLYCPWDAIGRTLVDRETFRRDLQANLNKIEAFGVRRAEVRYFVPPYEHYSPQIAAWTAEMGLTLVNLTPGTRAAADYTAEGEANFVPSQRIFESILARERNQPDGLCGFLLLMHLGVGEKCKDKFHLRLGELLDRLSQKGYRFVRIDELLDE